MSKEKQRLEFRYYTIPAGDYILPKLGPGWVQEYGLGIETLHFHNYLEIGYCYHGSGTLVIEDRNYRYSDNMYTFIPPQVPHTTRSDPGNICKWEFLFIDMDEFIRNEMRNTVLSVDELIRIINKRGTIKSMAHHGKLGRLIRQIIEECRAENLYWRESVKGLLRSLVIEVLRLDEERTQARRSSLPVYIRSAVSYIEEHYAEDLKIGTVARNCGLSESHFRRIFSESMHMQPVEYLNTVRIREACKLMKKEDISMEEAGYRVGYQIPSTFNRNFKRILGQTPYQWKRENPAESAALPEFHITALRGWEGLDKDGEQKMQAF